MALKHTFQVSRAERASGWRQVAQVQLSQVVMDGCCGALLYIKAAQVARVAEAPQLSEPVQQPAFAVDLVSAHPLIGPTQLLLEVVRRRIGCRAGQVEDRVVGRQVVVAERTLVEVRLAELPGE